MNRVVLYPFITLFLSCALLWSGQLSPALQTLKDWAVPVSLMVLSLLALIGVLVLGAAAWKRIPRNRPFKRAPTGGLERVSREILVQTDELKGALVVLPVRLQEVFGAALFILENGARAPQSMESELSKHFIDLQSLYLWLVRENRFVVFSAAETQIGALRDKGADLDYQLTQWLRAFRLRAAMPEADSNPTLVELSRRLRDIAQQVQERIAALNESADQRRVALC